MIALGGRSFTGPFLAPVWSPPRSAGIYAVMVPGWRVMTFRALHFARTEDFSGNNFRQHQRYAEWLSIAGTEWNLYVAVHQMASSNEAQRAAVERALARDYRPEFNDLVPANKDN
ncbi:MAG: hypothetical protein QOD26_1079 [Betaproteobacteria bacterium]|nr:hypothetical protein [Betaproteobacteria bacterium]